MRIQSTRGLSKVLGPLVAGSLAVVIDLGRQGTTSVLLPICAFLFFAGVGFWTAKLIEIGLTLRRGALVALIVLLTVGVGMILPKHPEIPVLSGLLVGFCVVGAPAGDAATHDSEFPDVR